MLGSLRSSNSAVCGGSPGVAGVVRRRLGEGCWAPRRDITCSWNTYNGLLVRSDGNPLTLAPRRRFLVPIYDDVTALVGNTPLVRINRLSEGAGATDRGQARVLQPGQHRSRTASASRSSTPPSARASCKPGGTIVEATSGNTGIALAMVGAARGYKVVLTMPETMSKERRALLRAFGAELILTPGPEGMKGAVSQAEEIGAERGRHPGPPVRQRGQPRDPPPDHGGGDLERHRRPGRHRRRRHRHRRHHHRRRAGAQGAQARRADDRRRAGRVADPQRRRARPAQDPGHRRQLRARDPRPHDLRRGHRRQRRDLGRVGPPRRQARRACSSASPPAPRSPRPTRSPAGPRTPAS